MAFSSNLQIMHATGGNNNQDEESRDITETAQVQIVHNSPYPVVDIYVDGALALEDVAYRASTGLIDLPVNTEVGIAPADGDVIATFPFELLALALTLVPSTVAAFGILKWIRFTKLARASALSRVSRVSKISKEFKAASHLKKEGEEYQRKHRL